MKKYGAYMIAQSLVCALAAGLMAWAAIGLYRAGAAAQAGGDLFNYIYTREKVGERLRPILPLIFAGLGMTAAGWLLGVRDEGAEKPVQDPEILRDLTCARVRTPSDAMAAERRRQRKLLWTGRIGFIACMLPVAAYCLNGAHFDRPMDTEADLLALLKAIAPFTALGFACLIAAAAARQGSMAREAEAAKAQAAAERTGGAQAAPAAVPARGVPQDGGRGVLALRLALLALAAALIAAGIQNGGLEDVLTKANAICMECVGLG